MQEFLATALSMPTLAFTAWLGIVLLYWVSVMVGALDIHIFDPGGALEGVDGAVEGGLHGAAEAAHGALDGAMEGAAEGAAHAAAHAAVEAGDAATALGGISGMLTALRLRYAPLTVVFSFISIFGWLGAYFGSRYLEPLIPGGAVVSAAVVSLVALVVALPLTSLITRPLAPLFRKIEGTKRADLIGLVVTVKTGKVTHDFGQATLDDGQAGLLLKVRCETAEALSRGDHALIVGWDEDTNAFDLEPMDELLGTSAKKKTKKRRR